MKKICHYCYSFFDKTGLIPILFLFCLVIIFNTLDAPGEYTGDEGFNLMKTFLYKNDYKLYKDIWNDQPPIFTVLLSFWWNFIKTGVSSARLLVLAFSLILIWSFYRILRLSISIVPALLGCCSLILSKYYLFLSNAILIGLPSISMASLSIYLFLLYKKNNQILYLILSGIFLAVSMQIKLFTSMLILIIIIYFILEKQLSHQEKNNSNLSALIQIWLTGLLCTLILIWLMYYPKNILQLFANHLKASKVMHLTEEKYKILGSFIFKHAAQLFFIPYLVFLAIHKKTDIKPFIIPLLWLISYWIVLTYHNPLWKHHLLLLTFPLCWLFAVCIDSILKNIKSTNRQIFFISICLLLILFYPVPFWITIQKEIKSSTKKYVQAIDKLIQNNKSEKNKWFITDKPIYAFKNSLLTPPWLTVFSSKRIRTNNINSAKLLQLLRHYKPRHVLIKRFSDHLIDKEISAYFKTHYKRIDERFSYYVKKD